MPRSARSGLRVFIVEDHADTRTLLQMHVETLGHHARAAGSIREATLALRQSDFDVLLCDIGLTDGLGWNFLESLHFTKPVFAIAISGANTPEDREHSRRAGFRQHLVKPLDFAVLNQLLAEAAATLRSRPDRPVIIE